MRSRIAGLLILLFDIGAFASGFLVSGIVAAYIAVHFVGESYMAMTFQNISDRMLTFGIESSIALFIFYNRGHYKRVIPWWSQVRYIALTLIFIMLIDGFAHFAIKYQFSRLWIVLSWVTAFVFVVVGRYFAKIVSCYLGVWKIPTVIIGDSENIIETSFALYSEAYAGYDVKAIVVNSENSGQNKFDKNLLPKEYANVEVIDSDIDLYKFVENNNDCFYILASDSFKSSLVSDLIKKITEVGAVYAIVPPIEGMQLYGSSPQYFFGHNIIFIISRDRIHSPFGLVVKRLVDVIASFVLLVIAAPLFIIIGFLIKKSGGSVFFLNKRLGKDGKEFYCLKFRTMIPNAEDVLASLLEKDKEAKAMWETHRKMLKDPRVTNIGRFLRKSSLDELPQLINILKGEMSLVGPRPILPDELVFFDKEQLKCYYSIRPGVTGLWQVSGRNETTFKHRVYLDSWYVKNWSLWCDFVILVKTAMVLIKGRGAY